MAHSRICSIPDCGKRHFGRGWCLAHYRRWKRHGDPIAGRIPNGKARDFFAIASNYDGNECLIWPFATSFSGYGIVKMNGRGSGTASRFICEHFYGPPPTPKHQAAHSCGKGHLGCVTKRHLSWKTPKENADDKIAHGTFLRGSSLKHSKLTEQQVREIRRLKGSETLAAIGRQFGVTKTSIHLIHAGKSWGWLDSLPVPSLPPEPLL